MIGAIIFLVAFFVSALITMSMPTLPPAEMIVNALSIPFTNYPVLGIPTWQLIRMILNGVVYGFIVWLAFTLINSMIGKEKQKVEVVIKKEDQPKQ